MSKTIFLLLSLLVAFAASAQTAGTTTSEVLSYKEKDGLIIVELTVNGTVADFMLDLNGQNTILAEYVEKLDIKETVPVIAVSDPVLRELGTEQQAVIVNLSLGNNVFANGFKAYIIPDRDNKLRSLGVAGTINGSLFQNCVLTINAKRQEITTSIPLRPSYMSLGNRVDMAMSKSSSTVKLPFSVDGKTVDCIFDTSEKALILLPGSNNAESSLKFVNVVIPKPEINEMKKDQPVAGLGLLRYGILSLDYPRSKVYFQTYEETIITDEPKKVLAPVEDGKLNPIGREEFLEYIFDYRKDTDFILKGDKPVVIDFWASWCAPCMKMLPRMEKMAEEYKGKVIFYKVNADKEKELCARFNVQALPTLFLIPKGGAPIVEIGALPEKYIEIIESNLLKE